MASRELIANPTAKNYVLEVIKAIIVAVIVSLILILIMAFVIKVANLATDWIPAINQAIKGVSILFACLFCLRLPHNGWMRGIIVGILYILLAFVVFSLLNGASFELGISLLNDTALGAVTGLLSGIIATLIRGKR